MALNERAGHVRPVFCVPARPVCLTVASGLRPGRGRSSGWPRPIYCQNGAGSDAG